MSRGRPLKKRQSMQEPARGEFVARGEFTTRGELIARAGSRTR